MRRAGAMVGGRARWWLVAVATVLAGTGGGAVGAPVAAAGDAAACVVTNDRTGVRSSSLERALAAAGPDDRLTVAGTCSGGVTLDRPVTLAGSPDDAGTIAAPRRGSTVVVSRGIEVTITGLTVEGGPGDACFKALRCGGAVFSSGTLTIADSTLSGGKGKLGGVLYVRLGTTTLAGGTLVTGGRAYTGAGAYVEDDGILVMVDAAAIAGNRATDSGGGVQLLGELYLSGTAAVRDNETGGVGGGGVHLEGGRLGMAGESTIAGNRAPRGGGIDAGTGLVQLGEAASVTGNEAEGDGGGVFLDTVIELRGSARIDGDTAGGNGGGIYVDHAGVVTMTDGASITGNDAAVGGGLYLRGIASIAGTATVTANTAPDGAGVWFDRGVLDGEYCGSSIRDNIGADCNLSE